VQIQFQGKLEKKKRNKNRNSKKRIFDWILEKIRDCNQQNAVYVEKIKSYSIIILSETVFEEIIARIAMNIVTRKLNVKNVTWKLDVKIAKHLSDMHND
jgi:hypothetical protein